MNNLFYNETKRGSSLFALITIISIVSIIAIISIPRIFDFVSHYEENLATTNAKTCYTEALTNIASENYSYKRITLDENCRLFLGDIDISDKVSENLLPDKAEWTNEKGVLGVFKVDNPNINNKSLLN